MRNKITTLLFLLLNIVLLGQEKSKYNFDIVIEKGMYALPIDKNYKPTKKDSIINEWYSFEIFMNSDSFRKYYSIKNKIIYENLDLILKKIDTLKFTSPHLKINIFGDVLALTNDINVKQSDKLKIAKFFIKHINQYGWEQHVVKYLSERKCATFPYKDFSRDIYKWAMRDNQITENEILLIGKYKVYALKDSLYKFYDAYEYKQATTKTDKEAEKMMFQRDIENWRREQKKDLYLVTYALANLGDSTFEKLFIQENTPSFVWEQPIYTPRTIQFYIDYLKFEFPKFKAKIETIKPFYRDSVIMMTNRPDAYSWIDEDQNLVGYRKFITNMFGCPCDQRKKCIWYEPEGNMYPGFNNIETDKYDEYLLKNLELLQKQIK